MLFLNVYKFGLWLNKLAESIPDFLKRLQIRALVNIFYRFHNWFLLNSRIRFLLPIPEPELIRKRKKRGVRKETVIQLLSGIVAIEGCL
jgi:hypothetical protein